MRFLVAMRVTFIGNDFGETVNNRNSGGEFPKLFPESAYPLCGICQLVMTVPGIGAKETAGGSSAVEK